MKLDDWLKENGVPRGEFARRIDVSAGYVTQLCGGTAWPGRGVIEKILAETAGAVTANDFMQDAAA